MDARLRLTFFCGTCLGLAVGFAAGHVSVWQRVASDHPLRVSFNEPLDLSHSASWGATGFDLPSVVPAPEHSRLHRIPSPGGAVVLNDPDLRDEPVHADALVELPTPIESHSSSPFFPPQTLAVTQSKPLATSAPLTGTESAPSNTQQAQAVSSELTPPNPQAKLHPEVVKLLQDELEGVSEQQREIWADVLQGMNPADAAGVIMMLKKSGQQGPGALELSPPPSFLSSHPQPAPIPHDAESPPHAPQPGRSTKNETDLAVRIAQHNQANSETCGYLEMIPVLNELPFDQVDGPEHAEVVGYRLDIEPGRHVETGNPAHVAVQRN